MADEIVLTAVGDFAPLRLLDAAATGSREVLEYLGRADVAMANLELPLTNSESAAEKAITLRAEPQVAASLRDAGLQLVSIANNHAMDYGAEGLLETLDAVRGAGVEVVGGGRDIGEAFKPAVVSAGEARIAVLGAATTLPPGYAAGTPRPGIAPVRVRTRFYMDSVTLEEQPGISPWVETEAVEEDVDRICEKIAQARERADMVVVQMHWGIPHGWCAAFQSPLADYQRPLAHSLVEAGADMIVGHHPHVVHGVERYGQGIIAYSLGNFLFHSMGGDGELKLLNNYPPYDLTSLSTGEALRSVILEARVGDGRLKSVRFKPVALNERGEPEFADGAEAAAVLDDLVSQSEQLGTAIEVEGNEAFVKIE